mgnify:CR=1 FL=1
MLDSREERSEDGGFDVGEGGFRGARPPGAGPMGAGAGY